MNFKKILLVTIFSVILFSGILVVEESLYWKKEMASLPSPVLTEKVVGQVFYTIKEGEGQTTQYQEDIYDNSTVFSVLKQLSKRDSLEVTSKDYDIGVMIESIDGYKNGKDNKYWMYYINDKLGEKAADKQAVKDGDKIEWRFEAYNF